MYDHVVASDNHEVAPPDHGESCNGDCSQCGAAGSCCKDEGHTGQCRCRTCD
jgi:hypothetical protein